MIFWVSTSLHLFMLSTKSISLFDTPLQLAELLVCPQLAFNSSYLVTVFAYVSLEWNCIEYILILIDALVTNPSLVQIMACRLVVLFIEPSATNFSDILVLIQTFQFNKMYYDDVIMGAIASQITSLAIVYSTAYSGADQRKHQSSASLAFVQGIHRGPLNSPHKWPVTRKMFPFDDVIIVFHDVFCKMVLKEYSWTKLLSNIFDENWFAWCQETCGNQSVMITRPKVYTRV